MTVLWFSNKSIFINWSIIIIACCDEGTPSSAPKICSSMIHVVIDKRTTLLYKSSKCKIFNRPLADGPNKFRELATPSFSPHCGLVRFVRRKCITVETIACIDHWIRCILLLPHHPRHTSTQSDCHLCCLVDICLTCGTKLPAFWPVFILNLREDNWDTLGCKEVFALHHSHNFLSETLHGHLERFVVCPEADAR